jgi:hypothetical protein
MALILGSVGVMMILVLAVTIKEMASADEVCGSCIHYRKCYGKHVEFRKQNTLELHACEKFKC